MIRPDYRDFRRSKLFRNGNTIIHSAKGSSWKKHKYIKRIDGTYYYPDSYEGGRHLSDNEKGESNSKVYIVGEEKNLTSKSPISDEEEKLGPGYQIDKKSKLDLSENNVESLAREVIRGNFGNGQVRKDLLGENYEEIQKRVNEILKGSLGSKKIPTNKSANKKVNVNPLEEEALRRLLV